MIHHPVKVGHLLKAFGKDGQMRIAFNQNTLNDVANAGYILALIEGQMVPFFIEDYNSESELIKFEEINGPQEARDLSDVDVFILEKDVHTHIKEKVDNSLLKDYKLYDQQEILIGRIFEVVEMPFQILFRIKSSQNGEEKLIPFHEDLIIDINQRKKTIQLTIADGLLDL